MSRKSFLVVPVPYFKLLATNSRPAGNMSSRWPGSSTCSFCPSWSERWKLWLLSPGTCAIPASILIPATLVVRPLSHLLPLADPGRRYYQLPIQLQWSFLDMSSNSFLVDPVPYFKLLLLILDRPVANMSSRWPGSTCSFCPSSAMSLERTLETLATMHPLAPARYQLLY
jgi:hypothetical protein